MIRLTYASDFVEEAVLLAEPLMAVSDRRAFRRARDPLYEIRDECVRDERFRALHSEWFERLGFGRTLTRIMCGTPGLAPSVAEARVLRAVSRHDEGADLVDQVISGQRVTRPVLVIRLRPATIADIETVTGILSHELLHVCDMLDPAFGYERSLPPCDTGGLTETIVRDRYRILWDATIDGRLQRAGVLPSNVRTARRREFEAAFPMLGDKAATAFDAWFDQDRPTHDDLVTFARMPASVRHEAQHANIR